MNKNEYRRAFIMLRAAIQGYGGHVRLERRTLTGSMYFIVTAPQGVNALSAALVGQRDGQYYAAPIGPLNRDRRGQLALAWQFDPRGIDGRPLEAYPWVVVAATGGPCAVALTGNVEGARTMDPAALSRAVCALFAPAEEPAADLPGPEPRRDGPETAQADQGPGCVVTPVDRSAPEPALAAPTVEAPVSGPAGDEPALEGATPEASDPEQAGDGSVAMRGDVRIYTRSRLRRRAAERRGNGTRGDAGEQAPEAAPEPPCEGVKGTESAAAPADSGAHGTDGADAAAAEEAPRAVTAARRLGLDITRPWPAAVEPMRRLFATQAPAETLLTDGFTYVRAPAPAGSGCGDRLMGLKAEKGAITAARWAVPACRTPEPPAALERYAWNPTTGEEGYWVLEISGIQEPSSSGEGGAAKP